MPRYPSVLRIVPLSAPPHAVIRVPGSKSVTNRALILAALADGESVLHGALFSDDTRVMMDSLRRLGFAIVADEHARRVRIGGQAGRIPAPSADLDAGASGTAMRFLTALVALGSGEYRIDGTARMRERPQADLVRALRALGVPVESDGDDDRAPLTLRPGGLLLGGQVSVDVTASSQFLSALLMVAPYAAHDAIIRTMGALRPGYVDMTRRMMTDWRAQVEVDAADDGLQFRVRSGGAYRAQPAYRIEPDASSASYFFAAAAVTGGRVTVPDLDPESPQGDVEFATGVLAAMGAQVSASAGGLTVTGPAAAALRGVDRDMSAISDTSLTLAAIAPFATSPTNVRNIAHARLQESDRISAVCAELRRLGVTVDEREDGFTVHPAKRLRSAIIETYDDHRIAMSFAVTGLRSPGISIRNPGCVAKTFPGFWEALEALRGG